MASRVDRSGRIASENYRQAARRLNAEASVDDRSGRPLNARIKREQARIAMRAAWAEETNDEPK